MRTLNIEHRTLNAEGKRFPANFDVRRSMFSVRRFPNS